MTPHTLIDSKGRSVSVGQMINDGKGGEGTVYELTRDAASVVKIYHRPPSTQTADKLKAMIGLANPELLSVAAWPSELVFDKISGQPAGFTMPRLVDSKQIWHLYNPVERLKCFPRAGWKFQIRAASNLAAAFDEIHKAGCIVGDVQLKNAFVSQKALVRLIDCDSFQIRANGKQFFCEVGLAHYIPPELQGKSLRGLVRTDNHDRFGMAVLIYQLLFVGRHPYQGIYSGPGDPSFEEDIAAYRFTQGPMARSWHMAPSPHTPTFDDIPSDIGMLFRRAFEKGSEKGTRPKPSEWLTALNQLEKATVECFTDKGHTYWSGAKGCVWCRISNRGGPEYYYGVADGGTAFEVDEARLAEIERRLAARDQGLGYDRAMFRSGIFLQGKPIPDDREAKAAFEALVKRLEAEAKLRRIEEEKKELARNEKLELLKKALEKQSAERLETYRQMEKETAKKLEDLKDTLEANTKEWALAYKSSRTAAANRIEELRLDLDSRAAAWMASNIYDEKGAAEKLAALEMTIDDALAAKLREFDDQLSAASHLDDSKRTSMQKYLNLSGSLAGILCGAISYCLLLYWEILFIELSIVAFAWLLGTLYVRHCSQKLKLIAHIRHQKGFEVNRSKQQFQDAKREEEVAAQKFEHEKQKYLADLRREYQDAKREAYIDAQKAEREKEAYLAGVRQRYQDAKREAEIAAQKAEQERDAYLADVRRRYQEAKREAEFAAQKAEEESRKEGDVANLILLNAERELRSRIDRELGDRRRALKEKEQELVRLEDSWKTLAHAYEREVHIPSGSVLCLILSCRQLTVQYQVDLDKLEVNAKSLARIRHLRLHLISDADIPGVGGGRKQILSANNIYSAYDVEEDAVRQISGFGDKLTGAMMTWRREIEGKFRFDRKTDIAHAELRALSVKYRTRQQQIVAEINREMAKIEGLKSRCLESIQRMTPNVKRAMFAFEQAEADLRVMLSSAKDHSK